MPDLKAQVGATDAQLGGALLCSAVGGLIAMAAAPRVGRLLGRFAMSVLCVMVSVALLLPLIAWNVASFAMVMFCVGILVASLDILTNVEISARESRFGLHLMGFNHAMFSFAFAGAALGTGLARQAGAGPADILPVLSVVGLVRAVLSYLPDSAQGDTDDAEAAGGK